MRLAKSMAAYEEVVLARTDGRCEEGPAWMLTAGAWLHLQCSNDPWIVAWAASLNCVSPICARPTLRVGWARSRHRLHRNCRSEREAPIAAAGFERWRILHGLSVTVQRATGVASRLIPGFAVRSIRMLAEAQLNRSPILVTAAFVDAQDWRGGRVEDEVLEFAYGDGDQGGDVVDATREYRAPTTWAFPG